MRTAILLLALAAAGCGKTDSAQVVPAPPAAPTGPLTDNLDYANWKKFPVGTVVVRKAVTSAEDSPVTTTSVETFTLRAVQENELTVERQNTTERSDGSYKAVNPSESRKYPRQFALPEGMTADDFAKPSRKAEKAGTEKVTLLGKEYAATVYAWTDSTEAGPMAIKLWLCDDVPGRIVKQTMTVEKRKTTTVEEVTEIKVP